MGNWKCKLARKLSCNHRLNQKSIRFLQSLSEVIKCLNVKK